MAAAEISHQDAAYATAGTDQANQKENGGELNVNGNSAKKSSGYGRQPYFCPYAKERMAK